MATSNTTQAPLRIPGLASRIIGRVRACVRFAMALVWILVCYLVILTVSLAGIFSRPLSARLRKSVSLMWARGVSRIMGMRIIIHGKRPQAPYFIVMNHIAWFDFYALCNLIEDGLGIVEEPIRRIPLVGTLVAGIDPVFVRRVKDDTPRVKELMIKAIQEGRNVIIAPETPQTTIRRGTGVRRFRGGLLEAAVITQKPVHYMSFTYCTPPGRPPPSKALVFGPNPFLPTPDGKIPESEWKMYERQTFLQHLFKVLSLPYFEVIATFAPEPIWANDRIELAGRLRDAVQRIFTPIE